MHLCSYVIAYLYMWFAVLRVLIVYCKPTEQQRTHTYMDEE